MTEDFLTKELCFQLYVASKEIIRLYKPFLAELDLTYTSFIALLAIEDNMSVKYLGEKLFLDSGTLSPLLKKMEHQGLLHRTRSETDERLLKIDLTQKGQTVKAQLPAISKKIYHDLKTRNPNVDYPQLMHFLYQLNLAF
ncbi:transcriptional regulator [Enterococcus saigonensis]|uniref:HTH-type transcriptional regulator SarZ n=1 Tax=Enterococcus saigonensis TaxID=1805431 RepID=A0A679IA47_9ENTE|nr:MarR family transcriptional regulator [Enterococcus saigonensis]BCA86518.1 transcriptional regulator [Enterococcus saigonensis]